MSGCEAKRPVAVTAYPGAPPVVVWRLCGAPSTAVYEYRCACGRHERRGESCDEHRPVAGVVGCSQCWDLADNAHECAMGFTRADSGEVVREWLARDDPAEDDGPAWECPRCRCLFGRPGFEHEPCDRGFVPESAVRAVCDRCGMPAVRGPSGGWMHADVADGVFCAMVYPQGRGVGSGGSE